MNPSFNAQGQMISQPQQQQNNNLVLDRTRNCYIDRTNGALYDMNLQPIMNNQTADGYQNQNENPYVYDPNTQQYINKYNGQPYGGTVQQQPMQAPVYQIPTQQCTPRITQTYNEPVDNYVSRYGKHKTPEPLTREFVKEVVEEPLPLPGSEYPPFLPNGLYAEKIVKNGYYEYKIKGNAVSLNLDIYEDYDEIKVDDVLINKHDICNTYAAVMLAEHSRNENKKIVESNIDMVKYCTFEHTELRDKVVSIIETAEDGYSAMSGLIGLNKNTDSLKLLDEMLTGISNNIFEYVHYLSVETTSILEDFPDIFKIINDSDDYETRENGKMLLDYLMNDILKNIVKEENQIKDSNVLALSIPIKMIYINVDGISDNIDRISNTVTEEHRTSKIYGVTKKFKELFTNLNKIKINHANNIIITKNASVELYKNSNDTLLLAFK